MKKKSGDLYSKRETERRRDEALRRALSTPPKPHKATPKVPEKKQDSKEQK